MSRHALGAFQGRVIRVMTNVARVGPVKSMTMPAEGKTGALKRLRLLVARSADRRELRGKHPEHAFDRRDFLFVLRLGARFLGLS